MMYVDVRNIKEIEIHIYVLGYYPIGESIFAVVWDKADKRVLKSVLFDCYEQKGTNKIFSLLNKYGLNDCKLDFVVWTHPDEDHSVGFEKLLTDYTSPRTIALLPEGVTKKVFDLSWFGIKRYFTVRRKDNLFKHLIVERVSCSNNRTYPDEYGATRYKDGLGDDLKFSLEIATPFSYQVFQKTEVNKSFIKNDLSLSILLRFGEHCFYFGGDTTNQSLSEVEASRWQDVVFVKIPHHASKSSDKLPRILEDNIDFKSNGRITAVSTSFEQGTSHLPEEDVLEKYKTVSDCILLTQDNIHANNYGIWDCKYAVKPFVRLSPQPVGDASEWYIRPVRGKKKALNKDDRARL